MPVNPRKRLIWSKEQPKKTINVFLAKNEKPAVQVDSMVWGRKNMIFERDPASEKFEFVSFVPDDNGAPFSKIKTDRKKECLSLENAGDPGEWVYTLTVRRDGVDYNSVEPRKPPGGDRPVIRN